MSAPSLFASFVGALRFFTRLRIPGTLGQDGVALERAIGFFPATGLLVGGVAALAFVASVLVVPKTLAVALAVAAFSLAGIPPLAGFIGKFLLFESAAEVKSYALIAFAVLNNVIALYYYIQLIKGAWVDKTDETNPLPALEVNFREKAAVVLLTIAVIFTGVIPFLSENIHYILSL